MKIIPANEAKDIAFYQKGKESAMSLWIKKLQVGEILEIPKSDWNRKQAPYYISNYVAKRTNRTFKNGTKPGFDGWIIKRLT